MLRKMGFTLVELVAVIAIIGLLAVLAIPRLVDTNAFERQGAFDRVMATLRYAQKAAIAQNQYVCVAFTQDSKYEDMVVTYGATSACGAELADSGGQTPYVVSIPKNSFSPLPSDFNFDNLGRPSFSVQRQIHIANVPNPIYMEAETGYVH